VCKTPLAYQEIKKAGSEASTVNLHSTGIARFLVFAARAFKHVLSAPGMATAYDESHTETRALGWREGVKLIVGDLDGSTVSHNKDNFF
jgi:hypothetical protein